MNDLMSRSFLSYVDLKKQALKDLEAEHDDIEMGNLNPINEENLAQFFEEVESIKTEMEDIRSLLVDLKGLNEETKSTHTAKLIRGLRDRMDSDMVTVLRKAQIIKARLEVLDKSNVSNRTISMSFREGSLVDRTRMSVTNGLRVKLRDLMNDFSTLREVIVTEHKEGLIRRYYNATGEQPTDEVIEKMIAEGGEKFEIFSGQADELNLEHQQRQKAVNSIQRSLMDLHKVFLDMAVLVYAQGEQMDDIEINVGRAGEMINGGTNALAAAKATKKRGWVWAVLLLLFIVVVILGFIFFRARPSSTEALNVIRHGLAPKGFWEF